jgi:hypothetical protein
MQKISYKILVLVLASFMLVSCAGAATPTQDVNAIMTAAISTMVASFFETQTAVVTPVTPTITETNTPFPTVTPFYSPVSLASPTIANQLPTLSLITTPSPVPTGTLATSTINPGVLAVGCNNLYFIRDVTIPAGTVMQRKQDFTKTWKVQNIGTCDWLYQYSIVLLSGDAFSGKSTKLQKLVKVNSWAEISVNMTTPNKPGTYTSYWRLSNGQSMFGATLVVSFIVADPPTLTPLPTITNTPTQPTETFTPLPTETPSPTATPTSTP